MRGASWRVMASSVSGCPAASAALHGLRERRAPGGGPRLPRRGGVLVFVADLCKEGKLGFWRWFWGAWGIGTYRKDDKVDVAWETDGRPQVAHALDFEPEG